MRRAAWAALVVVSVLSVGGDVAAWPRGLRRPPPRAIDLSAVRVGARRFEAHAFDGHVHTAHSRDARFSTLDVLALAERVGLDTLVITDHGSSLAERDVEGYRGPVVPLIGQEVGGDYGHALVWNLRDRRGVQEAAAAMPTLGALARDRGALVVLAHPGWWIGRMPFDPRRWMHRDALRRGGIAENVDALELWNGQFHHRTRELLDLWAALLDAGIYVPIVGNSDFHHLPRQRLGTPFNVFLCAPGEARDACLWSAVRAGRLYVSDGPMLSMDVAGHTFGEVVQVAAGARIPVTLRARAPHDATLELYRGRARVNAWPLRAGVLVEHRVELAVSRDTVLRVEIQRTLPRPDAPLVALVSNPVRIDVGARRVSWRGPSEGPVVPPEGFARPRPPREMARAGLDRDRSSNIVPPP